MCGVVSTVIAEPTGAKSPITAARVATPGAQHPSATDLVVDLSMNTTQHLVADIEALRIHLGMERRLV